MLRLAAIAALSLSACATAYQPSGLTGGYDVSAITPTRAIVSFTGNGYTSPDRVAQYVMLAAAETTHQRGFGHFAVIDETDASRTDLVFSSYSALNYGSGDATGYSVGGASGVVFPKTRLTIEMFPGAKPADAPGNVFNAVDVINTIRPQIAARS